MTQSRNSCHPRRDGDTIRRQPWTFAATLTAVLAIASSAPAQSLLPSPGASDYDFESSGYVVPAGMMPPHQYAAMAGPGGGVMPVGYASQGAPIDGGLYGPGYCDGGGCDGTSCGGGCGAPGGCGCGGPLGGGGLLGKLRGSCLACGGCGGGDGFADLCYLFGGVPMALHSLLPYGDAGRCSQRWYDISADAVFLGHNRLGPSGTLTTRGADPGGVPVLDLGDVGSTDLEAGFRVSGALLLGPGGNLEVTYLGNNEWDEGAEVRLPNTTDSDLFSFISLFGTDPNNGFDDTDRSYLQSIDMSSRFHSGEVNYRRRTVGPNCRIQGSWLVGLRYLRYDNGLLFSTFGDEGAHYFASQDVLKNNLAGAQLGGDLWWNMIPGVSLGVGVKGAWLNNDIDRRIDLRANSIDAGNPGSVTVNSGSSDSTFAGEFETSLVYRLSHSWSLRGSYYLLAIEDVAIGTVDRDTIFSFVDAVDTPPAPDVMFDRLVLQGFTFGAEYMW